MAANERPMATHDQGEQDVPAHALRAGIAWALFALTILGLAGAAAYSYRFAGAALAAARTGRPWYGNWGPAVFAMAFFSALIISGLALTAAGWWQIWRARARVTAGLYWVVRHPQYVGFLLPIVGFLIQWPTLLTVVLFPILIAVYYRPAQPEERELLARFAERYTAYRSPTPMMLGLRRAAGGAGQR